MNPIKPIFLFSLPRSGSTLLQRILSTHPSVATTPEPWILLPLLGMRKEEIYADYDHGWARRAIAEFRERVADTGDEFDDELRTFVLRLYRRAAGREASFFLDKTPRYHLIASEILDLFPDARALILWRNPLSIIASIIETWGMGRWNLYRYKVDLYRGLPRLIDLARQDRTNVLSVQYEEIVKNKQETLEVICDHLGVDKDGLSESIPTIDGRIGDPNQGMYDGQISKRSLKKWRKTISNIYRKKRVKKYLEWVGEERLSTMGYGYDRLIDDLRSNTTTYNHLLDDIVDSVKGSIWTIGEYKIYRDKVESNRETILHHS